MYHIMYDGFNQFAGHFRAGSLNQGADTASSEPILKLSHHIAIFKEKWQRFAACEPDH